MLRGDIPLTRCPCRENSCLLCNNIPTSTPHSSDSSHSQGKELSVCVYGSDSCPATPCSLRKETDKTQKKREKRKKQALNSNSTPMLKKTKQNPTTQTAKLFLSDYINKKKEEKLTQYCLRNTFLILNKLLLSLMTTGTEIMLPKINLSR